MELFNSFKVDAETRGPVRLVKGYIENANRNNVRRVTSVGGDNECGVDAGTCPLFDEIECIAGECFLSMYNRGTGVVFQIAKGYLCSKRGVISMGRVDSRQFS